MELSEHLGKEMTPAVVRAFAEAFIRSMPTGKQNTFANRTLCGAFERAVPASLEGYVEPSKRRLVEYAQQMYQTYADAPSEALTCPTLCTLPSGRISPLIYAAPLNGRYPPL